MTQAVPSTVRIVTHAGPFHADDLFAVAVLRDVHRRASRVLVERRPRAGVEARIAAGEVDFEFAVDVGGRHDASLGLFDHHQRAFGERRASGLAYASFGLVWKVFGEMWCRLQAKLSDSEVAAVAARVDELLVAGIDAVDVGASSFAADIPGVRGAVQPLTISHLVAWKVPAPGSTSAKYDRAFSSLLPWASRTLREALHQAMDEQRAASEVRAADDGSPLLVLKRACRWTAWIAEHHRFVVYPGDAETPWCIQCVGDPKNPMTPRTLLPASWAGLRGDELRALTGVQGALFCHRGRWLAGARTLDDAQRMVERVRS